MPNLRALIVEDDADINQIVATHLARSGWSATQAYSGSEASLLLAREGATGPVPFDGVICDLMLPGVTGEELIGLIRQRDARVPVIVASARGAASDRVDLLKLGADDYLVKPFDLDELSARIDVQLRHRAQTGAPTTPAADDGSGRDDAPAGSRPLRFRAWELDPDQHSFTAGGARIELTRIEFNLLEILMRQPKRVFSKQELFESAWGEPYAADDNTLNVHISNIRAKLRASGTDSYLKTVWGMGFKLTEA